MPKVVLIWILLGMAILIGMVVLTVLLERYVHRRKQDKYDDLHASMGLLPNDHEQSFPPPLDRNK